MRKLPTGEPCAGEPHARLGGRGGFKPFPTPIMVSFIMRRAKFLRRTGRSKQRPCWQCLWCSYIDKVDAWDVKKINCRYYKYESADNFLKLYDDIKMHH